MHSPMSEKSMIILGQLFMIVLSLVLAFEPRLYMVAIIVYFGLIVGIGMVRSRRGTGAVSREEVLKSRTVFKEDKALEIALEDDEYVKAMSKQAKAMIIPLLLFPLYIVIFRYVPLIENKVAPLVGDKRVATFIIWLAAFEAMFLLNQVIRRMSAGKNVVAPMVPAGYRVTPKGIVLKGGMGQVIGFPFPEGTEVRLNAERNYVEIRLPNSGSRIRLYSRKARRLYDIIARYGIGEGRTGEGKTQ